MKLVKLKMINGDYEIFTSRDEKTWHNTMSCYTPEHADLIMKSFLNTGWKEVEE